MSEFKTAGLSLTEMVVQVGFAPSLTKARHLIREGAIRLEGKKVTNPEARIFSVDGRIFLIENLEKPPISSL
jgi:ribosomal protein S4